MGTYKYADLTSILAKSFPKGFIDDYSSHICNMATNKIWMAFDWKESIARFPPVYLQPNSSTIGPPLPAVPSDFAGFREIKIRRSDGQYEIDEPLRVVKDLEITESEGVPRNIRYSDVDRSIILHPRPRRDIKAPEYFLSGFYKKLPVKITNSTLNTLLPFDDIYFYVWLEVARWAALTLAGDPKAGGVQSNGTQRFVNGQLAAAETAILRMASDQGVNMGDIAVAPSEPIFGGDYY